jgi:hypothetical protein
MGFLRKSHIFLIARYRRTSGTDVTARIPSAAPAAVMVTAATYPSVRMMFLLLLFNGSVITAHYIDVLLSRTGQRPASAGLLAACLRSSLARPGSGSGSGSR